MTKNEYLESQRGKSYTEIITNEPTELVQGSLLKLHYQEIKTILANGLRDHMNTFIVSNEDQRKALSALNETFDPIYMADEDFKVNFNVPAVMDKYLFCVSTGVLPQEYATALIDLAKYKQSLYNLTFKDCVEYFEPESLIVGDWTELTPTTLRLMLNLTKATPELVAVRIEQRVSHDGLHWTNWDRLMPIIVQAAGVYYHNIPASNMQRQIRWRGEEYRINGTIEAV